MMRILLWLSLSLPLTALAQTFGGGLLAGLNISQIDGDQAHGYRQPGLYLGGFLTYRLQERLALQPELVFEQLGSRDRSGFISWRLNYATLHLLFQGRIAINLGGDKRQEVVLEAGPALGYALGATDQISGNDLSTGINRVDLRGLAGGTLQLSPRWGFSLRYGYSLGSLLRRSGPRLPGVPPTVNGLFHNYIQFSLRYTLIDR